MNLAAARDYARTQLIASIEAYQRSYAAEDRDEAESWAHIVNSLRGVL